jgi:DNA-binding Lrp family transcriptional regulator
MKLTAQEKRIIGEIELDALAAGQDIARALRLKTHTVQHVIRRLKDKNAIQLKPFIDVSRLGKIDVAVFFSLAITAQKSLAHLISRLIKSSSVAFLQSLAGDYQFVAVLHCQDLKEARAFLRGLSEWSGGSIVSKAVIPRVRYRQYRRKFLSAPKKPEPFLEALGATEPIDLSKEERVLLAYFARGGIDSIRQAARDLQLSYSTTDYRYRQLVTKGLITGWFYDVNEAFLETQKFKLLIACKHLAQDLERKLEHFARAHPNITYFLETLGEWDFEIGIECSQMSEVMNIVALIHESFPNEISTIKAITELQTLKFSMFPEVVS